MVRSAKAPSVGALAAGDEERESWMHTPRGRSEVKMEDSSNGDGTLDAMDAEVMAYIATVDAAIAALEEARSALQKLEAEILSWSVSALMSESEPDSKALRLVSPPASSEGAGSTSREATIMPIKPYRNSAWRPPPDIPRSSGTSSTTTEPS